MGKVIKINGAGAKEESLKDIFENLHMLPPCPAISVLTTTHYFD